MKSLEFPKSLQPESTSDMLPHATIEDLKALKATGFVRFGLVTAVLTESGQIMMLRHNASSKTNQDALGPLAETSQIVNGQTPPRPESTKETFLRSLSEEIGIEEPDSIEGVRAKTLGAWTLFSWPVGVNHEAQYAAAISPVLLIDDELADRFRDEFKPNEEASEIIFRDPNELFTERNLRPGTLKWLGAVASSNLFLPDTYNTRPVDFTDTALHQNGTDINFAKIDIDEYA